MQALQMLVDMARRNGETAFAQEIQDMVESTLSGRPVTSKRVNKNFPMASQDKWDNIYESFVPSYGGTNFIYKLNTQWSQ